MGRTGARARLGPGALLTGVIDERTFTGFCLLLRELSGTFLSSVG